jgi:hypothetical protein
MADDLRPEHRGELYRLPWPEGVAGAIPSIAGLDRAFAEIPADLKSGARPPRNAPAREGYTTRIGPRRLFLEAPAPAELRPLEFH